jgi:hypothetical protein
VRGIASMARAERTAPTASFHLLRIAASSMASTVWGEVTGMEM